MIVLGNRRLLNDDLAVILNSSQSKTPCGNDPWVVQTANAVQELLKQGYTMITSIGLSTWELSLHLVGVNGGSQIIVSPQFDQRGGRDTFKTVLEDFNLATSRTAMLFVKAAESLRSPKTLWPRRDLACIRLAHTIVPVSIRPEGKLDELLKTKAQDREVVCKYRIDYQKSMARRQHYDLSRLAKRQEWNYITHWTKTCHGPWPGEKRGQYYQRVIDSKTRYAGNAFNTLLNIVKQGLIRASSFRMRQGVGAVGFTETEPTQMLKLMRWCSKKVNWNFEPYGVAIQKEAARQLGIRPVIYGSPDQYARLNTAEKPYFQNRGERDVDWRHEREWRHIGDLDLHRVPPDRLAFLVWEEKEAAVLERLTPARVYALTLNPDDRRRG